MISSRNRGWYNGHEQHNRGSQGIVGASAFAG